MIHVLWIIYLFTVKDKNTRKRCEICSKLTIKTLNDVNDAVLVSYVVKYKTHFTYFSNVFNFEQVNICSVQACYYWCHIY